MGSAWSPLPRRLYRELAAFGLVGAVCLAADVGLFNALAFGVGLTPVVAKLIGLVITGLMAFFGHRHITFRDRHGGGYGREVSRFLVATVATVVLSLVPLYVARHLLGITSVVGLNVANLVGIALGTIARYLAYRYMVWVHTHPQQAPRGELCGRVLTVVDGPATHELGNGGLLEVQHELVGE